MGLPQLLGYIKLLMLISNYIRLILIDLIKRLNIFGSIKATALVMIIENIKDSMFLQVKIRDWQKTRIQPLKLS